MVVVRLNFIGCDDVNEYTDFQSIRWAELDGWTRCSAKSGLKMVIERLRSRAQKYFGLNFMVETEFHLRILKNYRMEHSWIVNVNGEYVFHRL